LDEDEDEFWGSNRVGTPNEETRVCKCYGLMQWPWQAPGQIQNLLVEGDYESELSQL